MSGKRECSRLLSVKDFRKQFIEALEPTEYERRKIEMDPECLSKEMGVPLETVVDLMEVCSPSNLKEGGDYFLGTGLNAAGVEKLEEFDAGKDIPDGATLQTLKHLKRNGKLTLPKREINYFMKETCPPKTVQQFEEISGPEVVMSVGIYHPTKLNKVQEFLVLGRQCLTDLRDKIFCASDHIVPGDHSNQPDLSSEARARDICKSGFFFIEGVFYNDMRAPLCRDYSRVIIDWAKDENRWLCPGLGVFTSKRMEDAKFEDLKVKLGYPYLYYHQGNCEHLILFNDMRLLDADDPPSANEYPLQVFKHRGRRRICNVCSIYSARWVTNNDSLACMDPCFFCDNCFHSLHYSEDGEKLADFEAYPYMGDFTW